LYGAQHELTLANLPDGGCVARIRIPFQLSSDDRQEAAFDAPPFDAGATPLAAAGD